jgi:carbonic anhydrase/acetyltransferase-like protein (isoleucine patch superfamily)
MSLWLCIAAISVHAQNYFQVTPTAVPGSTSVQTVEDANGYVGIGIAPGFFTAATPSIGVGLAVSNNNYYTAGTTPTILLGVVNRTAIPNPGGNVSPGIPSGISPISFGVLRTYPTQFQPTTIDFDFAVDQDGLVGIGDAGANYYAGAGAHLYITDPDGFDGKALFAVSTHNNGSALSVDADGTVNVGSTGSLPNSQNLNVNGTTSTNSFQMINGATNSYILQSDATGLASWVAPSSISGAGLWAASGSDIYNTNIGNIGIGTTSPTANLSLVSTGTTPIIDITNGNTSTTSWANSLKITRTGNYVVGGTSYPYSGTDFIVDQYGNVGVGTSTPAAELDVAVDLNVGSGATIDGVVDLIGPETNIYGTCTLLNGAYVTGNATVSVNTDVGHNLAVGNNLYVSATSYMTGNVDIAQSLSVSNTVRIGGASVPYGYNLSIDGNTITNGLTMSDGASAGDIMVGDAYGNATWTDPNTVFTNVWALAPNGIDI